MPAPLPQAQLNLRQRFSAPHIVIATGGLPVVPAIEGAELMETKPWSVRSERSLTLIISTAAEGKH